MADLDPTIFPTAEFKGRWEADDPPEWETFAICLHGNEAGDFITEPNEINEALEASGYRLVLEKIDQTRESMNESYMAFRLWCFLAGKGHKVSDHRAEFDAGKSLTVHPDDLIAMVPAFDLQRWLSTTRQENE